MTDGEFASISRRELLTRGAALGAGSVLAVYGTQVAPAGARTAAARGAKKARSKGTLTVGIGGGSANDSLEPHSYASRAAALRLLALYEGISRLNNDFDFQKQLAESIESNHQADVWTVRLLHGAEFHNGKTVSADDLIFSVKRMLTPKIHANEYSRLHAFLDPHGMKKLDARTVRFKLKKRYSLFLEAFGDGVAINIIPVGFSLKKPIGTGPFKYVSYTPGQQSNFARFENYWGDKALVDTLIMHDIADSTARVNALQSGQVDAINQVPASALSQLSGSGFKTIISKTGAWSPIVMNCKQKPFNDVRVRQAFRFIANRPQMIEQAMSGQGQLGNDLYGIYDVNYDSAIPQRKQDIEHAKALLRKAGQTDLRVQLVTAPLTPEIDNACQVFAQNAKAAGVTVSVRITDEGTLYGSNIFKWPFTVGSWSAGSYLMRVPDSDGPDAAFPETQFHNRRFNALYEEAVGTTNAAKRKQIAHEMQRIEHNDGGYLIWSFEHTIDASSKNVHGIETDKTGFTMGRGQFQKMSVRA